jgi:hypothetical protein
MLREWWASRRASALPEARRLGLVHEQVAIAARHRRVKDAWDPHLKASQAAVLEAVSRCSRRGVACVVGAGDGLDVPVEALAGAFDEVILADVVLGPIAMGWANRTARRQRGRVKAVLWDATGALRSWVDRGPAASAPRPEAARELLQKLEEAEPGLPDGREPDLVISANCLSQLGLVPASARTNMAVDAGEGETEAEFEAWIGRCAVAAARRHLRWLEERSGDVLLLADLARLDVSPDGAVLGRESLAEALPRRAPDRQWRWDLAPIPEWDRAYHRVHEVGAWFGSVSV